MIEGILCPAGWYKRNTPNCVLQLNKNESTQQKTWKAKPKINLNVWPRSHLAEENEDEEE